MTNKYQYPLFNDQNIFYHPSIYQNYNVAYHHQCRAIELLPMADLFERLGTKNTAFNQVFLKRVEEDSGQRP